MVMRDVIVTYCQLNQQRFAQTARHYIDGLSLIQLDINQLYYFGIYSQLTQSKLLQQIQHLKCSERQQKGEDTSNSLGRDKTQPWRQIKAIEPSNTDQKMLVRCLFNMNSYMISQKDVFVIGNHYQNHIRCAELTVQEYHAEIVSMNHSFYLRDLGSQNGTYIKVVQAIKLSCNMLFQMGQLLVQILEINVEKKWCKVRAIYSRKRQQFNFVVNLSNLASFRIGRTQDNDFFVKDEFLCPLHAKILMFGDDMMIEDVGSINGTWLRLSRQKMASQFHKLNDKTIFKIGSCISYECEIKDQQKTKVEDHQDSKECFICYKNDRNILYLPCRHFISCETCSKETKAYLICHKHIESNLKIFTT